MNWQMIHMKCQDLFKFHPIIFILGSKITQFKN